MNVIVLNGSPKGSQSVTMQYVEFFRITLPDSTFEIHNVAKEIRGFEAKEEKREALFQAISKADLVLFAYPVYYMNVPSQMSRFMDLILKPEHKEHFKGKKAALFTTSIHFFDHTSHQYVRAVMDKLEMDFTYAYSAQMDEMMKKEGRHSLALYAKKLRTAVERDYKAPVLYPTHAISSWNLPSSPAPGTLKSQDKKVMILADTDRENSNLPAMVERFSTMFATPAEVVWLNSLNLVSGCAGCLKCAMDLNCVFTQKDGHRALVERIRNEVDILVIASDVTNCYLTARWEQFMTRLFFNGHVPTMQGLQMAFLFSGPASQYPYLREVFEGFAGHAGNNIHEYITDESEDENRVFEQIDQMATAMVEDCLSNYSAAPKFQAVAAHKIFRDEIYGQLGIVFQNDHKHYKRNKLYDFPTKNLGKRFVFGLLYYLLKLPGLRKRFYTKEMLPGMLRPYQKHLKRQRTQSTGS